MNITKLSLKYPLFVFVIVFAIMVLGVRSLLTTATNKLPNIPISIFVIKTLMPGASAQDIDNSITKLITSKLYSLPYLNAINAQSNPGISVITVRPKTGSPSNEILRKINQRLKIIKNKLPKQAETPSVQVFSKNSHPIIWLVFKAKNGSLSTITESIKNHVIPVLEAIKGVSKVEMSGDKKRVVNVALDSVKMSAYGINLQQVFLAFKNENFSIPGYFSKNKNNQYLLNVNLEFHTLSEIKNLIITSKKAAPIHISQFANIQYARAPESNYVNLNGSHSLALAILQDASAKPIELIKHVKEITNNIIIPSLPANFHVSYYGDLTKGISNEISALSSAIFYSIIFAILIVWFFVRNLRSSIVIFSSISISLLAAIIVINYYGETFNLITLMGLILLVGICVDDTIVVLENNFKWHMKYPDDPVRATLQGTKQVSFCVFSATTSMVIIFFSLITMHGLAKVFFTPFSVVIVSGVITSLLASLTVTPLLCRHFLVFTNRPNRIYRYFEQVSFHFTKNYFYLLKKVIRYPWAIILFIIVLILPAKAIVGHIGLDFLPRHANYRNLTISFHTGPNSNQAYTQSKLREMISLTRNSKQVADVFAITDKHQPNKGTIHVELVAKGGRVHTDADIQELKRRLNLVAGVKFSIRPIQFSTFFKQPLNFFITNSNFKQLHHEAELLKIKLESAPQLGEFHVNTDINQTQYQLKVNRVLANNLGISSKTIAQIVRLFGGNIHVGKLRVNKDPFTTHDILLQPSSGVLTNPSDISKIYLFGPNGNKIPLSSLAKLVPITVPASISRYNLKYSFNFKSTPTIPSNQALKEINKIASQILSVDTQLVPGGISKEGPAALKSFVQAGTVAIMLLYIVLTIQFNSLLQPFILLIAQPLGIIGALYGLWIFNMSINIYSLIGFLLLMGLISKNTILLVSLINENKNKGHSTVISVTRACPRRFTPIIMTSLTVILAMLPVFFNTSPGAENQKVLAITIISGIFSSTILSLLVVPSFYLLPFYSKNIWLKLRMKKT